MVNIHASKKKIVLINTIGRYVDKFNLGLRIKSCQGLEEASSIISKDQFAYKVCFMDIYRIDCVCACFFIHFITNSSEIIILCTTFQDQASIWFRYNRISRWKNQFKNKNISLGISMGKNCTKIAHNILRILVRNI